MDEKLRNICKSGVSSDFWDIEGVTAAQCIERMWALGLSKRPAL